MLAILKKRGGKAKRGGDGFPVTARSFRDGSSRENALAIKPSLLPALALSQPGVSEETKIVSPTAVKASVEKQIGRAHV